MTMRTIRIHSFPGFYYSRLDALIDYELEQLAEYENEKQSSAYYPKTYQRKELRVDVIEFVTDYVDTNATRNLICETYVDALNYALQDWCGFDAGLVFDEMTSPREYNFETDALYVKAPLKTCWRLYAIARANGFKALAEQIEERHSSRPGFISFYSNDLATWREKPFSEWDEIKLGTLLEAAFDVFREPRESLADVCTTYCAEASGPNGDYIDNNFRWSAFEARIETEREALKAQLLEDDPDFAPLLEPRCPFTPEMPF